MAGRIRSWFAAPRVRRRILTGLVLLAVTTVGVSLFLDCPPFVTRSALLSCVHCGNTRRVLVYQRWWQIHRVRCVNYYDYPVAPGHVHRWFQYNSKKWSPGHYHGWTREMYETRD